MAMLFSDSRIMDGTQVTIIILQFIFTFSFLSYSPNMEKTKIATVHDFILGTGF